MSDYHDPSIGDAVLASADTLRREIGNGDWSTISTAELRLLRAEAARAQEHVSAARHEAKILRDNAKRQAARAELSRRGDGWRIVEALTRAARLTDWGGLMRWVNDSRALREDYGVLESRLVEARNEARGATERAEAAVRERDEALDAAEWLSETRAPCCEAAAARLRAAIAAALPTIRTGLDAGGGYSPEAVHARIAAVDAVHTLADALDGEAPAAVLSAAELEVVRPVLAEVRRAYEAHGGGGLNGHQRAIVEALAAAGWPLAGEESEG